MYKYFSYSACFEIFLGGHSDQIEKFGNNSTCSNLPFTFEVKKTFENFGRAKIQSGLVNKGGQPIKKIGTKSTSSDANEAKTASNSISRSLQLFQDLSNGKMPTNVQEKMAIKWK